MFWEPSHRNHFNTLGIIPSFLIPVIEALAPMQSMGGRICCLEDLLLGLLRVQFGARRPSIRYEDGVQDRMACLLTSP